MKVMCTIDAFVSAASSRITSQAYATIAAAAAPAPQPLIPIDDTSAVFSEDDGEEAAAEEQEEDTQAQQGEQSSCQDLAALNSEMMEEMPDEDNE